MRRFEVNGGPALHFGLTSKRGKKYQPEYNVRKSESQEKTEGLKAIILTDKTALLCQQPNSLSILCRFLLCMKVSLEADWGWWSLEHHVLQKHPCMFYSGSYSGISTQTSTSHYLSGARNQKAVRMTASLTPQAGIVGDAA